MRAPPDSFEEAMQQEVLELRGYEVPEGSEMPGSFRRYRICEEYFSTLSIALAISFKIRSLALRGFDVGNEVTQTRIIRPLHRSITTFFIQTIWQL